jgi:hypothetical protein
MKHPCWPSAKEASQAQPAPSALHASALVTRAHANALEMYCAAASESALASVRLA